ncbi:BolA protein [Roseomonas mucosa]|jgi:BolA family transcriptional regulator, general stress-responsive regulator|uniref:Transcriptional regulator BolA n=1 Tax=Roseomonas mucosa TaxID=207340 RepID=A0A379MWG4_9PROT|nr:MULTISPECIES: BolA family protein [Roseomonas]MBS5904882.1 BolA family transcriptional regulator [Acetobacteraceae bacterium]MDT8262719.1 BolA family protein [Roseomonas sp. DSM 102946]ATR19711.1 BolA family transcriptional regulator [Roseomonas sp. FDAARGOS_362]MCG7352472.1 BolA family transcriptional regulator [Roseomonas mucosa]MCG7356901.1 BolA family transcriptional regulator [Roseomonas mucosa]
MIPEHPHSAGARAARLHAALAAAFPGAEVTVRDDSHHHAGHSGARPGGETHYAVRVVWAGFQGQSRVARQRAVNATLAGEFAGGLHALAIEARAPGEG